MRAAPNAAGTAEAPRSETAAQIASALNYLACEARGSGLGSLALLIGAAERLARATAGHDDGELQLATDSDHH
jgi:hypothetical protein